MPNKINHENKKLVVVQGEFPSSSATFILDQITGLIDRGFNVDNWAIFNSGAQITHEDVVKYNLIDKTNYIKLHYYNKKLDASVWVDEFIKANNLPQLSDIDAFHVHYGAVFNQLEPLFKCYNGFVVVSFHGYDASKYFVQHGDDCYSYLFQRANLITTPTYTMKQELVNRGCPAHKILIHRYGVDLQKFTSGEKRHDKTIVLGVGRLEEKKGFEYSIRAFASCKNKEKAEYRIVGDGSLKDSLVKLIHELNVEDRVVLLGPHTKNAVAKEMAQADLFVLTSVTASDGDCEGLPVALIEAHASGLPVISTYHAGIPELVEDGSSGFLVNERDIAGVAAKMELLIEDDTLRKLLSMNAAQRVQSDFNIDILNNSLATLFIDGINRGRIRDDHNEHGRDLLSNSIDVDTTTVSLPFPDDDTRLAGNKYPYISLVIPMYNAESTLDLCLDSISKLSYPKNRLEVILVDNGSTDASVSIAANYNVTLYHEPMIKSSYAARNVGILAATGELIAFTDADCIVTPGWLNHLAAYWEDQNIGCFAGEIEAYRPEDLIEKFSDREGILRQNGTLTCPYLPYTQTANSAYRKIVFDRVGLFVPEMTSGGDADLAWRMQKKLGLTIKFIPEALVYHKHRTSIEGLFNQFKKYEHGKVFWRETYPDYQLPSIEQRKRELDGCVERVISSLAANTDKFIKEQIDFVDLLTPFLKYIMSLGTHKARYEIENQILSSTAPLISVVIPTYNRASLLRKSLDSLTRQSISLSQFEVVVIDDGSSDFTKELCEVFSNDLRLVYRYIENSGISAAKNTGISMCSAPLILFFDDDDIAHNQLLEEHLKAHKAYPDVNIAVLGYTAWASSLAVTTLMHYVTEIGQQLFSYPKLQHGQMLGYKHFWGGRSSCKKSFLMEHGIFRPEFRFGSEDIELGYRLDRFGLKVVYNQNAISYMNRPVTFDEFCRRCEKQGKSQYVFSRLHPDSAIQKYCMVDGIDKKWAERAPKLEQRTFEARHLEACAVQDGSLLKQLYDHYAWCFESYKLKGIFEAMHQEDLANSLIQEKGVQKTGANGSLLPPLAQCVPEQKKQGPAASRAQRSILVIAKELPFHDRSSGNFRLFQIIRILASHGHVITFLARPSFREIDDTPYVSELEQLGVTVYKITDENTFISSDEAENSLCHLLSRTTFDIAYLMFYSVAELYLERIRTLTPKTRIVVDSVDIHFLREQRQSTIVTTAQQRDDEQNKVKELNAYRNADLVVVLTDVDRQALWAEAPQIKTVIIPNIHPPVPPSHSEYKNRRDIVFVGGFTHEPNIDAVEYFCTQIWPLVAPQLFDCRLIIAGNAPPPRVARFASERIIVTGYVENLPALLDHSRVSIAPLRFGAGMKGKVGEALAYGVPVVATTVAAEGMGLKHGEHLLIADAPADFARNVVDLYQDGDLWGRLSMNGKALIEQKFSPSAVSEVLKSMLTNLFTSQSSPVKDLLVAGAAACGFVTPKNNSLLVPGMCNICGGSAGFAIKISEDELPRLSDVTWSDALNSRINLRENIGCCSCPCNSRHRALMSVFMGTLNRGTVLSKIPADNGIVIFESSGMASYNNILASKFSYINTSYNKEIIEPGTYDTRLYADLQRMPYEDNTFDYIITGDVLEHVRDYMSAIEECFRVLKPGGFMLFTVPYMHSMGKNHVKVLPQGDRDVFLEEPEYHGKSRSLVYRVYGRELLDDLERSGFFRERRVVESQEFGFISTEVFICRKPEKLPVKLHLPDRHTAFGKSFAIKIGPPDRTHSHWGDIYYAECLAKSLERAGNRCQIHYLCEWGSDDLDIDVVIHLKGLSEYKPKPYNINIMWMLNHPSLHTKEELERYDAVLVASLPHAEKLEKELSVPVYPFLQATDPEHFRPYPEISKQFDLIFVGNNNGSGRLEMRKIVADLLPTPYRLAVWGQGWKGKLPPGVLQGDFIPWQDLPKVYAMAHIVLNDHQPEMIEYGFVNNRTFDAIACDAIVISDHVKDMERVLPVHSYNGRAELHALVDRLLNDKEKNSRNTAGIRNRVRKEFNFVRRVAELEALLDKMSSAHDRVQKSVRNARSFITCEKPLVSVLMSTYNRKHFLPAAIESILAQRYTNWELILVNDGGENVDDIVRMMADARIHLVNLENNCGKGHAINRAFQESNGSFIAYLDDDDVWYPDHLERLMLPLTMIPGIEMAYSDAHDVWLMEAEEGLFHETDRKLRYYHQVVFEDLLGQNHIQGIVVVHSRNLFARVGGMDEKLKVLIDWDLWRRFAAFTYPYHVSKITADHFFRESSDTTGKGQITNLAFSDLVSYERNKLRIVKKRFSPEIEARFAERLAGIRDKAKLDVLSAVINYSEKNGDTARARSCYKLAIRKAIVDQVLWLRRYAEFELLSGDLVTTSKSYEKLISFTMERGYLNYLDAMFYALISYKLNKNQIALETLSALRDTISEDVIIRFIDGFRSRIAASV